MCRAWGPSCKKQQPAGAAGPGVPPVSASALSSRSPRLLPPLPWARLRPSAAFHPRAGLQGFLAARCGDSLGTSASANISRPPSPPLAPAAFPCRPSLMGSLLQCPFTASPPIPSSPPPCGLNPAHRSVATALPGTGDLQAGEAGVSAPTPGYSRPPQPAPGRCPLPRLLPCSGLTAGPP